MHIRLIEQKDSIENSNAVRQPMNPANVFDIKSIMNELAPYDVSISVLPQRQAKNDLVAIPLTVSYVANQAFISDEKYAAVVYLYIDYNHKSALAMSRKGSDKQTMLLVSSIANKHIRSPFKFDKTIRNKV